MHFKQLEMTRYEDYDEVNDQMTSNATDDTGFPATGLGLLISFILHNIHYAVFVDD